MIRALVEMWQRWRSPSYPRRAFTEPERVIRIFRLPYDWQSDSESGLR